MFLGLDLGTSGLKAVLINDDQVVIDTASSALAVSRPRDGWSEQNPADWITAAEAVLDALGARRDLAAVRAIGLSGQMHGATALDEQDNVLRPAILWNDTRSSAEATEMDAQGEWRSISGNIVFPGFTAPKLKWMQKHEPELFARTRKVLLPKDYLRLWLTGDYISDPSDSAGTSWLNTENRSWSDRLLALSGLDRSHMPGLVEGSAPGGNLRHEISSRWGFGAGVVVAGGGGDNAASGIGVGAVSDGQGFLSLGTSGVLFAATKAYSPAPETAVHTFCHAVPGTWHQMGVILAATDALNWFAGLVGKEASGLANVLGPLGAPGRTLFLPYLGGERTPINDAEIRAAFVGLDHATGIEEATKAVLEGITFAFCDCRDALKSTGTKFERILAVGGGSNSAYWLEALATALNVPIDVPVDGDFGGAFGAARLGMMAATGGGAEIATRPKIARTIEPNQSLTGAYSAKHQRYKDARRAIKELT